MLDIFQNTLEIGLALLYNIFTCTIVLPSCS